MSEQDIFLLAVSRPAGLERERFLEEACGNDKVLRLRIEALIRAHEAANGFLDQPAFDAPTAASEVITEGAGATVGPYRLLQRIGEGGFGVVYMAEQTEPVRRKVALKIIKPGMDTKEVIARFESERQALALMDHPNIARVLDAGSTDSGRPYFVMELVKGVPITEFCDKNKLSVQERLALFVPVCLAVQHAHHKGVIHRDIKPSNVMVTLHDGHPVPKVIDFGVAKATSQQLTQRTLFTAYGQMIGTPIYMSPEQAEMSGLDIDTRSDIYSLGVLLYELLTGTTPIEQRKLREAGLVEMQRLIREVEAPKPSTRLSTLDEEATIICTNRGTDAKRLGDLLKGDVDWIVMKALEKDRQRRYDTPTAFADDIQRYLKHEAIHARPPSTAYRVHKFIQRNRGLAMGIGAVAAALLLGVIVSTSFAVYAKTQWDIANRERKTAEDQRKVAEKARDRAFAAEKTQSELTQLAEERFSEAEKARMSESQQRQLAEQQRMEAERQRAEAENQKEAAVKLTTQLKSANEQQRRAIYASDMSLVRIEAERGNLARMREILMDQLPIHGEQDPRGFEWHYWYRYMNQGQLLIKLDNFKYDQFDSAPIVPGGELVAVCQGGARTELREIATGKVLSTIPQRLNLLVNRTRFSRTGRSIHGACNASSSFWLSEVNKPAPPTSCTVYEPTGEKLTFSYPEGTFSHISFLNISDDGKRIVVLGNDTAHQKDQPVCRLIVWDVDSQAILLNQVQHRELNRIEFSPDGSMLAAHLCHGTRRYSDDFRDVTVVLDIATGAERGVAQYNDDIGYLFWHPDQQRLLLVTLSYSGANRTELLTWTIGDQPPQRLSQETLPNYCKGAVSPDGRLIAVTGHTTPNIRLIDTDLGSVVETLHKEGTLIDSLTFSTDGRRIIASSTIGEVLSWSLDHQAELFALRHKPLRSCNGFAVSDDQTLLAVSQDDGSILVRTRAGVETCLRPPIPKAQRGSAAFRFSGDNNLLIHLSNIGSDGKLLEDTSRSVMGSTLLELYDLQKRERLWQLIQSNSQGAIPSGYGFSEPEFTSDGQHVAVVLGGSKMTLLNCRTGESVRREQPNPNQRLLGSIFLRRPSDGLLMIGGTQTSYEDTQQGSKRLTGATPVLKNVLTGEAVAKFSGVGAYGDSKGNQLAVKSCFSADGQHLGLVRVTRQEAEILNLRENRQIVDAPGTEILFSPNGQIAAILLSVTNRQQNNYASAVQIDRIAKISVWDLSSGNKMCTISLAGDPADRVRFSPDGQRLLTLHGYVALGAGGAVPQGRLWDISSGRELLAMPVAEVNAFKWDLVFDPTGLRLTSLLLGKSSGTGGGGRSAVYDATPLSPEADAQLIAQTLLKEISLATPIPSEMLAEIDARPGLKPLVRDAAKQQVVQLGSNAKNIFPYCWGRIANTRGSRESFQQALRWAEKLHAVEPNTLRSRVALGGAQFRCGQVSEALETLAPSALSDSEKDKLRDTAILASVYGIRGGPSVSSTDAYHDGLRLRLQLIVSQRAGASDEHLDELRQRIRSRGGFYILNTIIDELSNASRSSNPIAAFNNEQIAELFRLADNDSNGQLTESDAFWSKSSGWSYYKEFDQNSDGTLSREEFAVSLRVERLLTLVGDPLILDRGRRLVYLNEAIRLAPNYRPALIERAWLLATLPDANLRNGAQAIADATRANESTEWKDVKCLDTLAASHAEAGNFDEAVKWAEQAVEKALANSQKEIRARLDLYRKRLPYREGASVIASSQQAISPLNSSAPLLAPDVVARSRRIPGWSAAWSPDSQKIVRNVDEKNVATSNLEIVDLQSGDTKVLCQGGFDATWSTAPDGKIAFVKFPEGQTRQLNAEQLWLVNPDGSELRQLTDGGFPSWTNDNRLFYRRLVEDKSPWLFAIDTSRPKSPLWSGSLDSAIHPAVSRDGTKIVRIIPGRLSVHRLDLLKELMSVPLAQTTELGQADFSHDGKYVVYGSRFTQPAAAAGTAAQNSSEGARVIGKGIWLIEVATGHNRLLADIDGTRPRWSPNGKFISIDQRSEQHILLLDISQLDLSQGLEKALPVPVKFGDEPAQKLDAGEGQPVP